MGEKWKKTENSTGDVNAITPTGRTVPHQFLSKIWLTSLNPFLSHFIAECDALSRGISVVSLGHLSGYAPFSHSCPDPRLFTGLGTERETEKALMQCMLCSATAKTLVCYRHCLDHRSKMQHYANCYEENYLRPTQIQ